VYDGAALVIKEKPDLFIGLSGGMVMDATKGIT